MLVLFTTTYYKTQKWGISLILHTGLKFHPCHIAFTNYTCNAKRETNRTTPFLIYDNALVIYDKKFTSYNRELISQILFLLATTISSRVIITSQVMVGN